MVFAVKTLLCATAVLSAAVSAHGTGAADTKQMQRLHVRQAVASSAATATTTRGGGAATGRPRTTAPATTAAGAAGTASAATSAPQVAVTGSVVTGRVPVSPLSSLSLIGTATTEEPTQPLPSTYAAGATPPVSGAPPLPAITALNPANYPALDVRPPLDSPQVQQWIAEADLANAPQSGVTGLNGCQNATVNAQALADAGPDGNCWWTCGGCTRATDISYCPTKDDFGVSYDDGPSPYTPRLLQLLDQQNIKSTFFIVGSRAISRPEMVQTEYMGGHQLSVHTWSHPALTTLSNEEIVAELGWTKQIIKDITGVTPNTMRPPYGDIDDRVRYISLKMGLRPVIWTSYQGNEFDTEDWKIGGGTVSATQAYNSFETILNTAANMPHGIIVLSHDLYQQSVDLSVSYIMPQVINAGRLMLKPISECLGESLADAYIETSNNETAYTQTTATVPGASGTGFVSFAQSTGGSSASSGASSSAGSSTRSGASPSGSSAGSNSGSTSGSSGMQSLMSVGVAAVVAAAAGVVVLA